MSFQDEYERFDKLPKRVQQVIQALERRVSDLELALTETSLDDAPIIHNPYGRHGAGVSRGLPDEAIRFVRGRRRYFDIRSDGDDLHVSSGDPLALLLQSTNVVRIRLWG